MVMVHLCDEDVRAYTAWNRLDRAGTHIDAGRASQTAEAEKGVYSPCLRASE